jgi:hypothetical protein
MVLTDEFEGRFEPRATPICPVLIIVAALRVGKDVAAPVGRAKEHAGADLPDDLYVIV